MSRTSQAGSWGLMIALAGSAAGADDGPPPLIPPADAPAQGPAPAPTPVPAGSVAPRPITRDPLRPSTNLLRPRAYAPKSVVVPTPPANQTSPFAIPARMAPSAPPDIPVFPDAPPSLETVGTVGESENVEIDAPPPLDGPSEMRVPTERRPRVSTSTSAISTRRVGAANPTRDVVRDEPEEDAPPSLVLEPARSNSNANTFDGDFQPLPDGPAGDRDRGLNRELDRIEPQLPDKPKSSNQGRRRGGLFGGFAAPRDRDEPEFDSGIKVEPRSDPAADASLKRKLEARVKDAVGNRAEDIEVRVVDRNVVIKARVDRFWNRRGVRRTIENLPALSGYKARVEIDD